MHRAKYFISLGLVTIILFVQVGGVFAAPALQNPNPVTGIIQSITLETDSTTGVTTVILDLVNHDQIIQRVRISQKKAIGLGVIILNEDGKPGINSLALGKAIEVDPKDAIPAQEENQHPVGSALATFFSDVPGVNYESIMAVHEQGIGFGVIAQTLWLTKKLEGNSKVFEKLLKAKQSGDYSAFILADGSTPQNWGQLKKAILEADKNGNGSALLSEINENAIDGTVENNKQKDKDKEKNNNENGTGNNKDKEKDKNK